MYHCVEFPPSGSADLTRHPSLPVVIKEALSLKFTENKPVRAFPGSRKTYVTGSRSDIRVPVREIILSPTSTENGQQDNPPCRYMTPAVPIRTTRFMSIFVKGYRL